ncbi:MULTISPECIES: hypothetical protein [unclassified Nocardia]|uniref:hypothetical protein n=1 Tax=unclassified Nocardia TaxID=2637762 RepID=UPI001CE3CD02|nr:MULTISPECIES: hypothetical protein [unclassified Nocardia]
MAVILDDIAALTRAADELLAVTRDRHHRRILENYRRHALLEVTGRWAEIFAPDMTVEHPVYYMNIDGRSLTLDGRQQVSDYYRTMAESGGTVVVIRDERLAVADWGFASEAVYDLYLRGDQLPDADPEGYYIVRQLIAMLWHYDDRARLTGEHSFAHPDTAQTIEIDAADYIGFEDYRRILTPLIRPLPEND